MWLTTLLIVALLVGINPRVGLLKDDPGRYFVGLLWREVISVFIMLSYGYWCSPALVGALWGIEWPVMILGLLNLIVSWGESSSDSDDHPPIVGTIIGILYGLYAFVAWASNWAYWGDNAKTYAEMLGNGKPVKEVLYTPSIKATDPRHLRAISFPHADALMRSNMNQSVPGMPDRMLGSQFQVDQEHRTIQRIRGKLYVASPLEFKSYGTWSNMPYVPGFLMMPAEDPLATAELVEKVGDKPIQMRYMPSAYFAQDLNRHLWLEGNQHVRLHDFSFEVDDDLRPWWVVSVLQPQLWNGADKVTGVIIIDPETGTWKQYPLGTIPAWVDRVFPADIIRQQVEDWGLYRKGWGNAKAPVNASQISLFKPVGDTVEVFGDNEDIMWHTSLTTTNDNDDTLVGFVHADTRTGEATFYKMTHGATHVSGLQGVADSVLKNSSKLGSHVSEAIPAKIYGRWMLNFICDDSSNRFSCFVLVDVSNPSIHAIGDSRGEALRNLKEVLARSGDNGAGSEARELLKHGKGKILRMVILNSDKKSIVEITVDTMPGAILRAEIQKDSLELPLAKVGDTVDFEYNEVAGEREVQILRVDVFEIPNGVPTSTPDGTANTPPAP